MSEKVSLCNIEEPRLYCPLKGFDQKQYQKRYNQIDILKR